MSFTAALLAEFDEEMTTTRRLLERVPGAHMTWKPHEKSFPLGHLTQLVARMPSWITNMLTERSLDLLSGANYSFETPEALLAVFDANVRRGHDTIAAAKDADLGAPWSLMMGDRELMSVPRTVVLRQTMNHFVHHRGQLTVYLRLRDIPIPCIYGPTADERPF